MRLGLIAGTILYGSDLFAEAEKRIIETTHGRAVVLTTDELAYVPRHGLDQASYILPHRINNEANLAALKSLDVDRVVSLNSTGSLKPELVPTTIVIPDDYISLMAIPSTSVDRMQHSVPVLSAELRTELIKAAARAEVEVVDEGVYWQTTGPRFETRAEVRFLANFADLVGMTMGSEAAAATELGMEYAALCSVDNFGHGLVATPLSEDQIIAGAKVNREKLMAIVTEWVRAGSS